MRVYKGLSEDGNPLFEPASRWPLPVNGEPGAWRKIEGPLTKGILGKNESEDNALYFATRERFARWLGPVLYEAEARGALQAWDMSTMHGEILAPEGRLVRRLAGWTRRRPASGSPIASSMPKRGQTLLRSGVTWRTAGRDAALIGGVIGSVMSKLRAKFDGIDPDTVRLENLFDVLPPDPEWLLVLLSEEHIMSFASGITDIILTTWTPEEQVRETEWQKRRLFELDRGGVRRVEIGRAG